MWIPGPLLTLALATPLAMQDAETESGPPAETSAEAIEASDVRTAARVLGSEFTDAEIELMLPDVRERLEEFGRLRAIPLENGLEPALYFLPWRSQLTSVAVERAALRARAEGEAPARPADLGELLWADIATLHGYLVHRVVRCEELAELFLARLERLDPKLRCVITLTRERALAQARALDAELEAGTCRGLLHGIPWVAKDLLATRGVRTTWGAKPYEDQVIDLDATVVERLDAAGAVLIAKTTLGALAWGDVWFGARTNNPWNLEQGSSGSSAGPAAAVAAGCAVFGIGSETLGSIVSPSDRCGVSSLRPTFGRISRHGAMTLSWSMDKLGPMCRSAADAAIVLDVLHGADARDPTSVTQPFDLGAALAVNADRPRRVGFVLEHFEREGEPLPHTRVLEELEALGVELLELELPDYPVGEMTFMLQAESASAFEELSRSGDTDAMVRQERYAWPNVFRHARLISAVDYLRAARLRTRLIDEWNAALEEVDALVHPSFAGGVLSATNLTGHPTFVAPCGFREDGTPRSVSFTGKLFGEEALLAIAGAWQASTGYHREHPDL